MQAQISKAAVVLLALAALAWPASSPASSALSFIPCAGAPGFSCAQLPVPLDRQGAAQGTISLSVERKLAGTAPSASAMIALAGGPGQPALPFAEFTAVSMAPALRARDLLVFDQRGTGSSDPIGCPALESFNPAPVSRIFADCAAQIGPARGGFTTQESVQDIEALRQAGGYSKLVLYGTSYGTKVALEYAERYPQHVEALVLDSVVPSDGPEAFALPTFQALDGVIKELCSGTLCTGITPEPLADLSQLIGRLRRHALKGSVYDGLGRRHQTTIDELRLLEVLEAGDLNPALRALLPAAVRSALRQDPGPLLRLQALSEGLIPNVPTARAAASSTATETDEALFVVTTCEEAPFPWNRANSASGRLAEALAYLHAQPASAFGPFDAATALGASLVEDCDAWPDASPPPPAPTGLPDVPTLILSGSQDLRTPTSNAQRVAAAIPGAQVEVVPFTGHSVIGSDLTGCAAKAVAAFFAGSPVQACTDAKDALRPTPITPTHLAKIHPPSGLGGAPGKTLVAVLDTLLDLNRQVIAATIQADTQLPSGASFGGLRGGYAQLTTHSAILKNLSFVPGVRLSGTFPVLKGRLLPSTIRIDGANAAHGTVRIGSSTPRVSGTLDGHSFNLSLAKVKLAGAEGGEWPDAPFVLRGPGRQSTAAPLGSQLP
jgi:pimeloyl-ACP methyl ester carboxylesterase